MTDSELIKFNNAIQEIGFNVEKLAKELAHVNELDPDFTLLEIAKIHACLLNINSKIYILKPDLTPKHLEDCDWSKYIPQ